MCVCACVCRGKSICFARGEVSSVYYSRGEDYFYKGVGSNSGYDIFQDFELLKCFSRLLRRFWFAGRCEVCLADYTCQSE